jgi:hypothetical protein
MGDEKYNFDIFSHERLSKIEERLEQLEKLYKQMTDAIATFNQTITPLLVQDGENIKTLQAQVTALQAGQGISVDDQNALNATLATATANSAALAALVTPEAAPAPAPAS